jgi:Tol biopolymer transport system component
MIENPISISYTYISDQIPESKNAISIVVSADEKYMAFVVKMKFQDAMYYSAKTDTTWGKAINITSQIKSDGNQIPLAFSPKGDSLLFSFSDPYDVDIYVSTLKENVFSPSKPLNKNICSKFIESRASLSANGGIIYFSSDRKDSEGLKDIYYAIKDNKGDWGPAFNIGKSINSIESEDFPYICDNDQKLYFQSRGFKNMGGYDLFYVTRQNNRWSLPVNVGYPINTTDDDTNVIPVNNNVFYAVYTKEGVWGKPGIYRITINNK